MTVTHQEYEHEKEADRDDNEEGHDVHVPGQGVVRRQRNQCPAG